MKMVSLLPNGIENDSAGLMELAKPALNQLKKMAQEYFRTIIWQGSQSLRTQPRLKKMNQALCGFSITNGSEKNITPLFNPIPGTNIMNMDALVTELEPTGSDHVSVFTLLS